MSVSVELGLTPTSVGAGLIDAVGHPRLCAGVSPSLALVDVCQYKHITGLLPLFSATHGYINTLE